MQVRQIEHPDDESRIGRTDTVARALAVGGGAAHVVGVCQATVPVIAAATLLHQVGYAHRPISLSLLGGPVDPRAAATSVTTALASTSLHWLEKTVLQRAPEPHVGADRLVYPAATQQQGLLTYLARQLRQQGVMARSCFADDGLEPDRFPFLAVYTSVKDIPGRAFIESIAAIFHNRALWNGGLIAGDRVLDPRVVTEMALLTVEAAFDDIAAPGQTAAAHRLFTGLTDADRRHLLLEDADHFSLFHGRLCRDVVAPEISRFIRTTHGRLVSSGRPCAAIDQSGHHVTRRS